MVTSGLNAFKIRADIEISEPEVVFNQKIIEMPFHFQQKKKIGIENISKKKKLLYRVHVYMGVGNVCLSTHTYF